MMELSHNSENNNSQNKALMDSSKQFEPVEIQLGMLENPPLTPCNEIIKPKYKFKPEDLEDLHKKFVNYSGSNGKLSKFGFGRLISATVGSLEKISNLIFHAIIKEEDNLMTFEELVEFFEDLLSNSNGECLKFSFRLVTKTKKEKFSKEDLRNFLKEIKKLDQDLIPESESGVRDHLMKSNPRDSVLNQLTEYIFEDFSLGGKLIEIDYERFCKVLYENDNIFVVFKSLNGGLCDFLLLKEAEINLKKFSQDISGIELRIKGFLDEELIKCGEELQSNQKLLSCKNSTEFEKNMNQCIKTFHTLKKLKTFKNLKVEKVFDQDKEELSDGEKESIHFLNMNR